MLMMLPPSGPMGHSFLSGQQKPEHVRVEVPMELGLGNTFERRKLVDAGIVDQNVDRAKGRLGFGEQAPDLFALRDIALDRDGLATFRFDGGHDPVGALTARRIVDHHGRTLGRQRPGDPSPDAFRGPRDDRDLACQFAHVTSPV